MRITADVDQAVQSTSTLDASLDAIEASGKKAAKGLNAAGQAADSAAAGSDKARTAAELEARALERQNATRERLSKLLNTQRGQRILEAQAVDRSTAAIGRQTISMGQYNMAMRQLPMQITDIVTSLASGQNPMLVAVQQGGQLKDSFGGIVPAANALLGAINPLTLGIGGVALAISVTAKAAWDGYQELEQYERIAIATGNAAGTTASAVDLIAASIDNATSRFGEGREAMYLLLEGGRATADVLEDAARAAVALAGLTRGSIEESTQVIQKLLEEPAKYSAELNKQYNYLEASIYQQIVALERQGRATEAQQLAVETFATVTTQRLADVTDSLGALEKGWHYVKVGAAAAWNEMLGIGRQDSLASQRQQVQELAASYERQRRVLENANANPAAIERIRKLQLEALDEYKRLSLEMGKEQETADKARTDREKQNQAIAAQGRAEAFRAQDRAVAKTQEIAQLERDMLAARKANLAELGGMSLAEYEKARRADIEERFKPRATPKPRTPRGVDPNATAQRELENLQKQVALLGQMEDGQKRASEEARIRYEIEEGSYRLASSAVKQQLLDQAKLLDAKRAEREEQEKQREELKKTQSEYGRLRDALRTPAEVALDNAIERVATLNAALAKGVANSADYQAELAKIVGAGFSKPPDFSGLSPEIGGFDSEQFRLDQSKEALRKWYDEQQQMLEQFRANKVGTQEQWNAQELQIEAQHQEALDQLQRAQAQLTMTQVASTFDSMAQMAKAYAGEQSRTYQALFAISKGFAVAQAAVALAQNVAEASKAGWPENIPKIAMAFAQGAQIAQLLSAAQYASGGRINGPGTGTSDSVPIWASAGEFMIRERSASQPGAYPFLEDFNRRGMPAVQDWRGYAEGGLITREPIRSGQEPSYQVADARSMSANVSNRMRLYNLFDVDKLAQMVASHPAMEKKIVTVAAENGQTISAEW